MKNSRIARKIYLYSFSVLIMFSLLTYIFVSISTPTIQNNYKKATLEKDVAFVVKESKTIEELRKNIEIVSTRDNTIIKYKIGDINYSCPIESECFAYKSIEPEESNMTNENLMVKKATVNIDGNDIVLHFYTASNSIAKLQSVLLLYLPIFMFFSVIIVAALAYLLARRLSSPVIVLDNAAKRLTKLDFSIEHDLVCDDEFGDLSLSLVTLAKSLEKSIIGLQDANDKLSDDISREKAKEEKLRAVIALLSHDLKTPLTSVKGQTEGMLYNIGKYKDHQHYLEENLKLIADIENMVSSIIVSSQLDEQESALTKIKFNVKEVVLEHLNNMDYMIESQELKIATEFKNDYYFVDPFLFSKVINNLLSNALEYCDKGGSINIRLLKDCIIITNTNKDFDTNALKDDLIFKPFYRQDLARNKKGTGLGLDISKKIASLHNIGINVDYENTDFTVSLTFNEIDDK